MCISGFYKRICLNVDSSDICLDAKMSACVNLPRNQRGIHVSRNVEAIIEAIGETKFAGFKKLEEALHNLTRTLLNKHTYASMAETSLRTLYIHRYSSFMGMDEVPTILMIRDKLWRDGREELTIGVMVKGMTVCPCAQEVYAYMEKLQSQLPHVPSHSQRALASVNITLNRLDNGIDLARLIDAVINSFSAPVLNYLKRESEYRLVRRAFENPRFVEDVARSLVFNVYEVFTNELRDEDRIAVKVVSFESIHPYNLYAYSSYSIKELREKLTKST
ncbi:MAG: GTP cyclohydrolase, FolE2/MptA family [Vulcanisaeta sp.]|nr:GTP cyclohydrolase, FolE2/MptA family [Vulcanisaeta sp.]